MPLEPRTPVLVGYGQVNQHTEDPSVEPVDLMVAAAREAADPRVLESVDAVRVVNLLSWRYRDPGLLLAQRIRADKAETRYTGIGGNVPQTLVNLACLDIQKGRADVVLIAGAETWRTRSRLRVAGKKAQWTRQDDSVLIAPGADDGVPIAGPAEIRINLDRPAYVYPMFEQAVRIAARELGLPIGDPDRPLTVTGGLTFAGGPWNNYVTHSIATMAEQLVSQPGTRGLITANGGYLTKHSFGVYGTRPPEREFRWEDVQPAVDREPTRTALVDWSGTGTVESWTTPVDRGGRAEKTFLAVRTSQDADVARVLAVIPTADEAEATVTEDIAGATVQVRPDGTASLR